MIAQHISRASELEAEIVEKDLRGYLEYWLEEFSGIVPEEITLLLNIGVLYILTDYQHGKAFAMYSVEKQRKDEVEVSSVRELAVKSIETNHLPSFTAASSM